MANRYGIGKIVYHVAHPEVPATIRGQIAKDNYVDVIFERPVAFSELSPLLRRRHWGCNIDLLWNSSGTAKRKKTY